MKLGERAILHSLASKYHPSKSSPHEEEEVKYQH